MNTVRPDTRLCTVLAWSWQQAACQGIRLGGVQLCMLAASQEWQHNQ